MKKDKPICKIYPDGFKAWYLNDELHREDGPAVEHADGSKEWWLTDEVHREDGPAIEFADGTKFWYLNGISYTKQAYFEELVKRGKISLEDVWIHLL